MVGAVGFELTTLCSQSVHTFLINQQLRRFLSKNVRNLQGPFAEWMGYRLRHFRRTCLSRTYVSCQPKFWPYDCFRLKPMATLRTPTRALITPRRPIKLLKVSASEKPKRRVFGLAAGHAIRWTTSTQAKPTPRSILGRLRAAPAMGAL